ncbi:hypothetical protein J4E80_004634 [Alternaria sp. BMP 0032]|nr:hypothetical protein J4E80_004634 [Alternaria sp. BMP 0032]
MRGNRLIIAIDYGTTFTGIAFCETSDTGVVGKTIILIQDWPCRNTRIATKDKVPSELALKDFANWGSLIAPTEQRHMWTKLLLDDPKAGEVDKIMRELSLSSDQGPSTKPVEIIAKYLAHIKAHTIKNLDIHYGKGLWQTLPLTLVVTVPAVWSDAAKHSTLQAVDKAGFNSIELPQLKRTVLTTEPEAAAIYTIQSMRGGIQDDQFAVGDGFVVCDMGGGTVDLISYRVAELDPTTLEEATVGSGDQCGGSFVERGFMKWLERRLGTADFISIAGERSEDLPRTSLSPKLSRMVQDFVMEVKTGFSGHETSFLRLPVPLSSVEDDEARGIQDGEIMITPQFVFMVGGFSESPYMYEKIKLYAESHGLAAIRPAHAWSAIVRGAAAKGLEGDGRAQIMNRKCRRHYGTQVRNVFIAGKHDEVDACRDPFTGTKMAGKQMEWLLNKGQDLSSKSESHAYADLSCCFWPRSPRSASLALQASNVDNAPTRARDKGVYTVATLEVDLSGVPQSAYETCTSMHGGVYYSLDIKVEMVIQSSLEFSLMVEGVRYGAVTANYA